MLFFYIKVNADQIKAATSNTTINSHWSVAVVEELKTKEFPGSIKNVWLHYVRAMDGSSFINIRFERKEDGYHNYRNRLYSLDGTALIKEMHSNVITPLGSKKAYINGEEWDLIEKKSLGKSQYTSILVKERSVPRSPQEGEQDMRPEETVIEQIIGIISTKNPKSKFGDILRVDAHALDANLKVVKKLGPFFQIHRRQDYVYTVEKNGVEKTYNWDLSSRGEKETADFKMYQAEMKKKDDERALDFKLEKERIAAETKADLELKKSNEACFEQARATRNLEMAYKCGQNLGDKYGNWLLDESEADVEAIGQASKQQSKMNYLILHKLSERFKILKGLGHKNMKALEIASGADEARRKREAIAASAAAKSANASGTPVDYNKSYKEIQWQQSVNKGGPTWEQINSNGK